ncbi:MAG: DUF898 domain-containing protein [Gammaproteobacteria bacterium]|nr:DUF898 domain-containing protein [Gammaproteobacteria bacterium]
MQGSKFEVFYFDLQEGVTQLEAIEAIGTLLNIHEDAAEEIVSNTHSTLSSGLDEVKAERYFEAFSNAGLRVEIRPCSVEQNGYLSARPPMDATDMTISAMSVLNENEGYVSLKFNGHAFEYFKIWIVNIFLTIVTLGIYSAWAKVRNKQYFYGNTVIDGSSFQYTAKPMAILIGRIIAVALFVLYSVVNHFNPLVGGILFLLLLLFLPWIILRSLKFNARNSMFRNIRFNFTGNVKDAISAFILWPMLMPLTLGLILPLVWYKQSAFFINNSAFGTQNFEFNAEVKDYYKIFGKALGLLILGFVILGAVGGLISPNLNMAEESIFILMPFSIIIYVVFFAYISASLGNLYFNSTTLQYHGFYSQMKTAKMGWLYFTHTVGIVLSLGLLIPWAQVRTAKYKIECLTLEMNGSLDEFINAETEHVNALGEQVGEVFDMDVSIL